MPVLTERRRLILVAAALVFAVVFAVYATALRTTVAIGDEAEAQTVPYILGIAHPTGFPAYTLAGWVFSHGVPFSTVAWRLNLFATLCSALCAAGIFLLAVTLSADVIVSALAAFAFAFGKIVWTTAVHPNAQTLAELLGICALLAAVHFARSGRVRDLLIACACCGFGLATHPSTIWVVPALAVALCWQRASVSKRALVFATIALVLPLSLYLYLPLRSMYVAAHGLDPTSAAPLFGAGNFDWDANSTRTLTGFLDEVLGRQQSAGRVVLRTFDPGRFGIAARFWFDWAMRQYPIWMFALVALGIAALARVDRRALSVVIAGTLGSMLFASGYRFDGHLDRYLLLSFGVTAALAAASARLLPSDVPAVAMRAAAGLTLALLAGFAMVQNRPPASLPGNDGQVAIEAALNGTPDGSIIVAEWNDAAALGYAAFIDHALGTRMIVTAWPNQYADEYPRWVKTRPVRLLVSPLSWGRVRDMPAGMRVRLDYSKENGYAVIAVLAPQRSVRRRR